MSGFEQLQSLQPRSDLDLTPPTNSRKLLRKAVGHMSHSSQQIQDLTSVSCMKSLPFSRYDLLSYSLVLFKQSI
jgi:hypothetical protein